MMKELILDENIKTQLESAAFRRLLQHFQAHPEVQNIDLMILADFCRNCLAKWYAAAAQERDIDVDYEHARDIIYGMPYKEWQTKFQTEASPEKLAMLETKLKAKS
jgi:uncharacterized protein